VTETRSANRPEPAGELRERRQMRVAMTAAFLTGHPLAVSIAGYGELESELASALGHQGWRVEGLHAAQGTFESGGGFAKPLPLVIARRDGPQLLGRLRELLHEREGADEWLARHAAGLTFSATALSIDIYDLGVGVLSAWFDVSAPARADLARIACTVKSLAWLRAETDGRSPIAEALLLIGRDSAEQYGGAVRSAAPGNIQASWLSGGAPDPSVANDAARGDDRGRLLWLHPVHVMEAPGPIEDAARQLAPAFHRTVQMNDGVFAPGVGWSAIVTRRGSGGFATPLRLTELHWAYYALYMEIDRGLLKILNRERWSQVGSLKQLEVAADSVFADYLRVMEARARLDSALASLGGDELAIWEVICDVQRFDAIVDAVDRKINILQRLSQRRVDQAAAKRARRTSEILAGLTALTVVTVAIALIGYFVGTRSDAVGHAWLRVVVIVAAFAVSLGLFLAYRGRTRRRGDGR
jgi:hypothetical protein